MSDEHPVFAYCRRELEVYRNLLADYKSGRRKIGESADGYSWTDATDEKIVFLEKKIRDLSEILKLK